MTTLSLGVFLLGFGLALSGWQSLPRIERDEGGGMRVVAQPRKTLRDVLVEVLAGKDPVGLSQETWEQAEARGFQPVAVAPSRTPVPAPFVPGQDTGNIIA